MNTYVAEVMNSISVARYRYDVSDRTLDEIRIFGLIRASIKL